MKPLDGTFGVNTGRGAFEPYTPDALRLAAGAGIGWVRFTCLWGLVEPRDDVWSWETCDSFVEAATNAGLNVLFTIFPANGWCTTSPAPNGPRAWAYPPCDYEEFREYVHRLVSRYGSRANGLGPGYGRGQIHHWEVVNEPDLLRFWEMPPGVPEDRAAAEYARLLQTAYEAIKAADPVSRVVLGGLALVPAGSRPDFLGQIVRDRSYPALANFDIANFHTYGSRDQAAMSLEYVRLHVAGKPIWITEIGFPSVPALQKHWPHWERYPEGEAGQSAYLADVMPYLLALGVEKTFWYTLVDVPRDKGFFCSHGLFYLPGHQCQGGDERSSVHTLQAKPSYLALQELLTR